jgi:hypothetical protein
MERDRAGKAIDYLAPDIMRLADGLIIDNWHVKDHETLHWQLRRQNPPDNGSVC